MFDLPNFTISYLVKLVGASPVRGVEIANWKRLLRQLKQNCQTSCASTTYRRLTKANFRVILLDKAVKD
jgi:hypothetical protein